MIIIIIRINHFFIGNMWTAC